MKRANAVIAQIRSKFVPFLEEWESKPLVAWDGSVCLEMLGKAIRNVGVGHHIDARQRSISR